VDLFIVVSAQLLLLLCAPTSDRLFDIPIGVLAADHESNLTGRIGRDSGVSVFDGWKDLEAGFLQRGDQGQV